VCGIAGYVTAGAPPRREGIAAMAGTLSHRGPDDAGVWVGDRVGLGNRRLAVLDRSTAGHQPMVSRSGRYVMTYNGEVYNYVELRHELGGTFLTGTDTEVVLEAFDRWGLGCLPRFNGMFALAVWDRVEDTLLLARDRFGVKPLYYAERGDEFCFASEIKALAAAGVPLEPDGQTWASYLVHGVYDHEERTFFKGVRRLLPGHVLVRRRDRHTTAKWYDLAGRVGSDPPEDVSSDDETAREYLHLLEDAVRLRFRSDVPVGICLSGGLDSSLLFALVDRVYGATTTMNAYHFATNDVRYDETPWVERMVQGRPFVLHVAELTAAHVPDLATQVAYHQEEPFGGVPTLAMAQLFARARENGTVVLLDGQGLDEQWAGYDYYVERADEGASVPMPVQGSRTRPTRPECLNEDFRTLAGPPPAFPSTFREPMRASQHRDLAYTKIPRALRFSDRTSSQFSRELREPFLDYRLVEYAFRTPAHRLVRNGTRKFLLRRIAAGIVPPAVATAPKRSVQTPQREWLRGPLRGWVEELLGNPGIAHSGWFDVPAVRRVWQGYLAGDDDNSFFVWQWLSVPLTRAFATAATASHPVAT
jgi:asparagine synthase (glutamine-hydrolysing)